MNRYKPKHQRPAEPHRTVGFLLLASIAGALGGLAVYLHADRVVGSIAPPPAAPPAVNARGPAKAETAINSPKLTATAPFVDNELAGWVVAENARPGTSAWRLARPSTDHQIEGYASAVSVNLGVPVNLYVSTTAPTYAVEAFRMGYYGGQEGRLVWSSPAVTGEVQSRCLPSLVTRTISCSWMDPLSISTTGWPQGDYLLKLTASTGFDSYVPLTVRDDSSQAAYLINNSVTTWQAYNEYGGYDLYQGVGGPGRTGYTDRALAVSFDRPYVLGHGAGDFIGLELPMVATMESLGLDVTYTTDIDVSEQPLLITQHRAFISLGHDEYYTLAMREGVQAARDAGVNLVFLGANAIYRHIRLASSPLGPDRLEIDYKNPYLDPLLGRNDADVTPFAWRDWPNGAPESALLGEMWQCNPVRADMVITEPDSWLLAGTGLAAGSRIPGIVGPEYDHYDPYAPNPGNVSVIARSPVRCDHREQEADMTYYSAASGGGVWDTGTIDWVGSVLPYCAGCRPANAATGITANVLAAFGVSPAGSAHPSIATFGLGRSSPSTTISVSPPSTVAESQS